MSLSSNLKLTATKLIDTYGNTVTLSSTSHNNTYNPQTGEFGGSVDTTYTKKAYEAPITTSLMMKSGIPENEWGSIKGLYVFVEDVDIATIDHTWTINGRKVTKVKKVSAQDTSIVVNVYIG